MENIVSLFRSGVPCKNRVYDELKLKKNKNNYKLLIEFKKILLDEKNNNNLGKSAINNMFIFLMDNLKYDTFTKARNVADFLNIIQNTILKRMDCIDKNSLLYKNYKYILYHIEMFKSTISYNFNLNINDFETILKFENIIDEIVCSRNLKKTISIINENIDTLLFYNHEGNSFEDILFNEISMASLYDDIVYYKQIITHVINTNIFSFNKERFKIFLLSFKEKESVIGKKISSLEYSKFLDRYLIKKDLIISIDNKDTLKVDDALSIDKINDENYLVGIHIADVYSLGYDEKIVTGGLTSNRSINKKDASLIQNKDRNSVTLFVEIDVNGVIKDYRLIKTRISVNENMCYDDVSRILSNDISCYNKLKETIQNLTNICKILEYNNKHELDTVNEMGHCIINRFMTLYGCLVAEYFYNNNIPCIYLSQSDGCLSYTLDSGDYDTNFENYHKYVRATSPIYDKLSLFTQSLIHIGYFNSLDENTKNAIRLQLESETKKLNNKSNTNLQ